MNNNSAMALEVCVLSAGVGSRMKSDKPKALQTLGGQTFLGRLLETLAKLAPVNTHVIIGQGADQITAAFSDRNNVNWVLQEQRLGTGHAMQQAAPHLGEDTVTLILLGDGPLIRDETLRGLLATDADLTILTVDMDDPYNYGRIVRDDDQVTAIVEEKDASEEQKQIVEINTGAMAVKTSLLKKWLDQLTNDNAQKEYLLTDIVAMANGDNCRVKAFKSNDPVEVTGVNTYAQLAALERKLQQQQAQTLMGEGVQVMDPARLDVRGELSTGRGVVIDVNVVFEGKVVLGDNVSIGPNCVITDSVIGDNCVIKANSVLEGATLSADCAAGPFARLRPGAELGQGAAIGNFVEVKKSKLGKGTKASHLAYLGDATIGDEVNIGAGTITCNYDGVNKWETHIGDGVFVGSNSSLVAPVTIGEQSTIGAGSTITKAVADGVLAVGRGRQTSIENWQRPQKSDKKES